MNDGRIAWIQCIAITAENFKFLKRTVSNSLFFAGLLIDVLEFSSNLLALFPTNKFQAIADHMNNTKLHFCLRTDRLDGFNKTVHSVNAANEHILQSSVLKLGQNI